MKKTFIIVIFFFNSLLTFGQITDDFSDGDFTSNPIWTPDNPGNWVIQNGKLQSNSSTVNAAFFITTPSTKAVNTQWEFLVNLNFNTSSANYVDVYLTSELSNLTTTTNKGYFVRIGGTLDEISLYKVTSGTATILINGTDGVTNSSENIVRIKVTRDINNLWTLQRDITGGVNYSLEGTATDNSFSTSNFFGILVRQSTSSFFYKHSFDNFYIGNIIFDTTPPTIQSLKVLSDTELMIGFDESLDPGTAQSMINFSANNGIGNPSTAVLQADQKSIKLTFSIHFPNGVENELNISSIKDLYGNVIGATTRTFSFSSAIFNDVVINELLPDPSPQIGLPAQEFVEIYNRSNKTLDLTGWKLSDPTTTAVLPALQILPNDYVVLTNSAGATSYATSGKVIGLSNFPTLNNDSDKIKLVNAEGLKIDSISYKVSWYQNDDKAEGGWTLERLNPQTNTNDSTNWRASEDLSGGTPGKQNSVFGKNPDAKPPILLTLTLISSREIKLDFNESLPSGATLITHYTSNNEMGSPSSVTLSEDLKSVQLLFQKSFINGFDYTLTISGIQDLAGNVMPDAQKPFRYFIPTSSGFKDIIISEIMADPSPIVQLPEAEYIELFNRTNLPFDLKDWKLTDATGTTSLTSFIILPNEYAILTSTTNASKFYSYGKVLGVNRFPSLNNDGEPLALKNELNQLIDSISYSLAWYKDDDRSDGGWSLELIDPQNICGEEGNWISGEDEKGGTPGKKNSVFANKPDLSGPKLLSVIAQPQQVVLTFDEKLEKEFSITSFKILSDVHISSGVFTDLSLKTIQLNLSSSLTTRTPYQIEIKNLHDCAGNSIQEDFNKLSFALPEAIDSLDFIINEILFNPKPGSVDFVEIYNHSPKYLNLKNFKLANYENGEVKNEKVITTTDVILEPEAYLVFTEDPSLVKNNYPSGIEKNFYATDLPSFNDDEGSVVLLSDQNHIIDVLNYSEDYHSPLIKDNEGISLERISFTSPTNDPSNWRSATAATGYATPGYLNSNARPETVVDNGTIEITPEVFSPSSGINDFASIQYKFEQTGYIANVKIYDQQGRAIKEISNNEAISESGAFRWDGDRSDGTKARNGYYVVRFEVFDLNGKVKTYRKRVVLASSD